MQFLEQMIVHHLFIEPKLPWWGLLLFPAGVLFTLLTQLTLIALIVLAFVVPRRNPRK